MGKIGFMDQNQSEAKLLVVDDEPNIRDLLASVSPDSTSKLQPTAPQDSALPRNISQT